MPSAHGEWSIFGSGNKSHAGVSVTVESSLGVPAVYACVQVISQDVAKLPLITYRRLKRGKERAIDWVGYRALHNRPNPEMTSYEWREFVTSHVASWGNSYSEIDWTNSGTVRGLWPLRPDRMRITRKNGRLIYHYTLPNGQEKDLAAWRIHHIKGLGADGVMGWSPTRVGMQSVGLNIAAEEYGARWYVGGGQPRVIAVHPNRLSQTAQEKLQNAIEGSMSGLSNSHRVKVLEEGVQLHKVGVPAEEAQFLEAQEWGAHQVCRLYRMPPHKIGLLKNATFSNIEHQAIEYVTDTLQPWLVRHEQALSRDLLSETEQAELFFEYLIDGALRGDVKSRNESYAIGRQWGWLSANDIRERENLNPIEGGDSYLVPLNMVASGQTAPAVGKDRRSQSFARLYEDALGRVMRREVADIRRAAEKHLHKGNDIGALRGWLDEFYRELAPVVREMVTPAAMTHAEMAGMEPRMVEQYMGGFAADYVLGRRKQWDDVLIDEDLAEAAEQRLIGIEQIGDAPVRLAADVEQLCR